MSNLDLQAIRELCPFIKEINSDAKIVCELPNNLVLDKTKIENLFYSPSIALDKYGHRTFSGYFRSGIIHRAFVNVYEEYLANR